MDNREFLQWLRSRGACPEGIAWAREHGGAAAEAWQLCGRPDWLLWSAFQSGADQKLIVHAGCAWCVRGLVKPGPREAEARNRWEPNTEKTPF